MWAEKNEVSPVLDIFLTVRKKVMMMMVMMMMRKRIII
jgi:hypothetical protein